jgi:hypothetical protein
MARHPEVSEKSIIQGGIELEKLGKSPNPGSIRAHLGYRGGLMRIKSVWDSFTQKRNQELLPESSTELSFDALPDDYANNATQLMERVSSAIEQLTIEAYVHSQRLFEKRLQTLEGSHEQKLKFYIESESSADQSITRLEAEIDDAQRELQQLAGQNAKLLIENSELRGRLSVFEEKFQQTASSASNG